MNKANKLEATGLGLDVCNLILDQLQNSPAQYALLVKKLGGEGEAFAIKDDDFPLLEEAGKMVVEFLGAAVTGWAPMAVASLVILLYNFRRKRTLLTALQAAVITELKSNPNATEDVLVELLNVPNLGTGEVRTALNSLSKIQRQDRVTVSLVSADASGHWRVEGV